MAIIGISGKIRSGKNLTGQIIQYLISEYKNHGQILNSFNIDNDYSTSSGWQQKAFAYKLKQIVSILTGISVENLEKQEVKDRVLGDEWHKKINVVDLEDMQALEFGIANGLGVPLQVMTVRQFLQRIGTEAMRNVIHENVWVNALFADYYPYPIKNSTDCISKWIITDVRFPNELKAIEDRGGISIRVNTDYFRQGNAKTFRVYPEKGEHFSETALDNANFKYTVNNNGTIEELIKQIKEILIKEHII